MQYGRGHAYPTRYLSKQNMHLDLSELVPIGCLINILQPIGKSLTKTAQAYVFVVPRSRLPCKYQRNYDTHTSTASEAHLVK